MGHCRTPAKQYPLASGYPTVLMIKILVLQQLYNLADDALESFNIN